MLGSLVAFVDELRQVGVPVSMVEVMDASAALEHTDIGDRESFRAALAATLVKNARHIETFDATFDIFYGLKPAQEGDSHDSGTGSEPPSGGGGAGDAAELFDAIVDALSSGDRETMRMLARRAVSELSGIQPGRPVGGRYYFYRVMRRLGAETLVDRLLAATGDAGSGGDPLDERLRVERAEASAEMFRSAVRQEIVRRLVEDRGPEAVAQTLRTPLVEDVDLMHATRDELTRLDAVIAPLARKLATRLAVRMRRGRRGRLDVRRTIRRSLEHGGALVTPRFKPPRVSKPELVLLCDVSGSMATFARFTLQLTYAISHHFSRVRSFAFVDGIDEVTRYFGPGVDFSDAVVDMSAGATLVWRDGHSDYGAALEAYLDRFGDVVTPRSTVIVTGDARSNYRDARPELVAQLASRARALFWLNPESHRYWDTGDSVMSTYAPHCSDVVEVRTLRQLERFVERVALHRAFTLQRER
jgi:uncharacterized protein